MIPTTPATHARRGPGRLRRLTCILLCLFMLGAASAWAQPEDDEALESVLEGFEEETETQDPDPLEEILSGFEDDTDQGAEPAPSRTGHPDHTIEGTFKLGVTWNVAHDPPEGDETDWRGLSRLRPEIHLEMCLKPLAQWQIKAGARAYHDAAYTIRREDRFTREVIDQYQQEVEWREVFVQGRLGKHLDLKFGRQIVVWGRSDNIRITDVLNPLDLREPGLTDIEDLRLPVTMTRLDGFHGPWNLTLLAVHEIRFNKAPVFGSDFFPADVRPPDDAIPSDGGENTEWAAALNGVFSGWDLSFYWAELFDDQTHVALVPMAGLRRRHARITMQGAAGNLALGNWLLKAEGALFSGLEFFNAGSNSTRRMDGLIGFEYSGLSETTISWEWAARHYPDFDVRWKRAPNFTQETEVIHALRITREFANDTVNLTLLIQTFDRPLLDAVVGRLSAEYDWTDAVTLKSGLVLYQSGEKYTFSRIGDNDRIFAEIAYRF